MHRFYAYPHFYNIIKFIEMKKIFLSLILLTVAVIGAKAQNTTSAEDLDAKYTQGLLPIGTEAPDFVLRKAKSEDPMLSLSDYRTHKEGSIERPGCYVILDFWATWCPDCRKEIPTLKEIYKKYKKKVKMIGVSFDTDKDKLKEFRIKNELKWSWYSEFKKWKDTEISGKYHIQWLPTMYLIDPEGKVAYTTVIAENMVKKLEELDQAGKLTEYMKEAVFPGGIDALHKAIRNALKYPEIALKYKGQAKIKVEFIVDEKGNATDVAVKEYKGQPLSGKAFNSLTLEEQKNAEIQVKTVFSQEAIRVVTWLTKNFKWIPAQERGKNIKSKYNIPINFVR